MLVIAALCGGAFVALLTLWVTGFGAVSSEATARLGRLKADEESAARSIGQVINLRRRGAVSLGGINLVSANLAAKWGVQLEQAGLTLNAREFFILRVAVTLGAFAIALMVSPVPQLAFAAAPAGYFLVGFWVNRRIKSRLHKLEGQLVELLQMLASGLRAGFGLIQALDAAGEQLPAPLSIEVRRTLRDTAMGASIDQALQALNERIGSPDFDIVITAILIQRSVGGNLAEILDNVAHTMRERERIKGEIRTLTSQQRMTGFVIGGIPIGLGLIFSLISPEFVGLLFTDSWGHMMLGGAVVLEIIGFVVISRIVNIEV